MSTIGKALKARELLQLTITAIGELPKDYVQNNVEVRAELVLGELDDLITELAGPEAQPQGRVL